MANCIISNVKHLQIKQLLPYFNTLNLFYFIYTASFFTD